VITQNGGEGRSICLQALKHTLDASKSLIRRCEHGVSLRIVIIQDLRKRVIVVVRASRTCVRENLSDLRSVGLSGENGGDVAGWDEDTVDGGEEEGREGGGRVGNTCRRAS
jgi:hypothetical protein